MVSLGKHFFFSPTHTHTQACGHMWQGDLQSTLRCRLAPFAVVLPTAACGADCVCMRRRPSRQSLHWWQHPLPCTTGFFHQLLWSCRSCVGEQLTHRMSSPAGWRAHWMTSRSWPVPASGRPPCRQRSLPSWRTSVISEGSRLCSACTCTPQACQLLPGCPTSLCWHEVYPPPGVLLPFDHLAREWPAGGNTV